ncbi:Hsp20/alpha crystallin family protein [Desulfovirgula thermocuniculi]|uniref:Hsp20/alpha crystallin family protein n=1 Tax=Desulfovirgula thermocuniculi TaxID=348842 RepID=UPI0004081456|nr:Hsp20/alpha crystallin family protein [Desulfovirgula thermocuniculi]
MALERYRGGGWWVFPWNPFKELEELKERLESFFRPMPGKRLFAEGVTWAPAVEMYEDKDKYIVRAELPGVEKDNIEVSVANNVLTIKGERKIAKEVEESQCYFCERYYGSFMRSVNIPGDIDINRISASYKDGLLEVFLPKVKGEGEKKINIKVE